MSVVAKLFVRVKPCLFGPSVVTAEASGGDGPLTNLTLKRPTHPDRDARHISVMNYLGEKVGQRGVYLAVGKPLLERALTTNSNPVVIAYGAKGTGKSHSLFGTPSGRHESSQMNDTVRGIEGEGGVSQELVRDLCAVLDETYPNNYCVNVSFLEVRDETLRDLLNPAAVDLFVRDDITRNNDARLSSYVDGLAWCTLSGPDEFVSIVRNP
jgi:hypothetical protein